MKLNEAKIGMKVKVISDDNYNARLTDEKSRFIKKGDVLTIEGLKEAHKTVEFRDMLTWGKNIKIGYPWYYPLEWVEPIEELCVASNICKCTREQVIYKGCICGAMKLEDLVS